MLLNQKQTEEMKESCKPLVKWICDNCHPHVHVIVDGTGAELVEGIARVRIEEFIKD